MSKKRVEENYFILYTLDEVREIKKKKTGRLPTLVRLHIVLH